MQEVIQLESLIKRDNYTEYVCNKFDMQNKEKVVTSVPMIESEDLEQFNWNIGLILGNSGSGKSTILSRLGRVLTPTYNEEASVISQFTSLTEEEACTALQGVGISSVPTWLKKPHELSNGERARLDLAWTIINTPEGEPIIIDEYTSVVNRLAAMSMSNSLQKWIRRLGKKIILASCHFDIIPWLTPDWIYNLNKQEGGYCEIERMVYSDDEEYTLYSQISEEDQLTNKKEVKC